MLGGVMWVYSPLIPLVYRNGVDNAKGAPTVRRSEQTFWGFDPHCFALVYGVVVLIGHLY